MPFDKGYDPETVGIMTEALEGAWAQLQSSSSVGYGSDKAALRRALALRITAAVRLGQRDPDRLRRVALQVVDGAAPY
jgi:hypothetical protein